jgi:hypothetical protein
MATMATFHFRAVAADGRVRTGTLRRIREARGARTAAAGADARLRGLATRKAARG